MLKESSLSRIFEKINTLNCGTISAFRLSNIEKENKENSRKLLAFLRNAKLDVTKLNGWYNSIKEESYFVCSEQPFLDKLLKFGKMFNQETITYKNKDESFKLYDCETSKILKDFKKVSYNIDDKADIFSKIKNKKFIFESSEIKRIMNMAEYYADIAYIS